MEALYESEFIDLKNFTKSSKVKAKYPYYSFEVIEQNTNNIYLAKEFRYPIYKFNRNEIISLSQEINVFSQVNHPSILKFIGYNPINFDKKPIPVIITEYTSNFTLKKMLSSERKGKEHPPIDDTKKLIILYGIAAGMSFLHSNNIIHCDLKPENILLDDNLYPKITGFMLSKDISNTTGQIDSELVGTVAYFSPEILLNKNYSKMSDVYAFSLILYEVVTNGRPFNDISDRDIIENLNERPKFNSKKYPNIYTNLIEKCWSKEPQERPSFDDILSILASDSSLLNENVNKEEFLKYKKFVDSSISSFNRNKRIHHLDRIINTQLNFFPKTCEFHLSKYSTCITPIVLTGIGFDFSDYEKHEKLGEGCFGKVYKIVNKKTGMIYSAKESFKDVDSFYNEKSYNVIRNIQIMLSIDFPSIQKFIGFNFHNIKNKPKPTFVFEYASNGSLFDILESERKGEKVKEWDETNKLITIFGIASAINYLHSKGIIHQDINPSNILFDEYLFPKLSDFCYVYIRERCLDVDFNDDFHRENMIIPGNPEYLAPEIFDDNEEASSCYDGRKSDIYSFAIVMYVIMTGDKPYNNFMKPIDIINYVKNDHKRPVFNKPIPDCYRDLIEKCWSGNPDDRPSSEDIVDILKTNTNFLTEKVDKEKYFNYIKYIESMKTKPSYDNQLNMPVFPKRDFQTDLFQKVDIYTNRLNEVKLTNLLINVKSIELNRYEIERQVGEGSFGTVYKIYEKESGDIYAAKISIYEIDRCSEDIIKNFEREVNIISKLNHPSIMKFIGFNSLNFKYKRKPTIITEYVSNGSLDKVIELERVGFGISDWNDTKKLINIFGIAKGMSYLHSLNILHRDLKPGNILLDDYLFPKISDFGLSKQILIENHQNNSGYKGTWAYTAPEVFEGKYSKAGDVYAFSLIVYEIMTNEIIFKDMNQFQVMIQVRKGYRPQFKYPIYECYRKLITDCWNEKPDKRPSFDEIVHRLKNDSSFLTENIDKNEFLNYISLLEDDELPNKSFHSVSLDKEKLNDNEIDKYSKDKLFLDLSKYEKVSLISKGDFHKTYKIKNKETGMICQGKISILQMNKYSRGDLINLSNEVNIISNLNHPSFMRFIGYSPFDFKKKRKPVILTEFFINDSLKKILDLEKTGADIESWNDTKKLINIFGIASAMAYLHSNNIIHRDLQPSNVYLDDYLFPKISDFGLSKRINNNLDTITYQTTSGLKGSPVYSSPEILKFNDYSKSSDVYSFSLVVYEILTNEVPFEKHKNTNDIYNEVVVKNNRPLIPDSMPSCYRSLIEKCWSQNPNERPTFNEIVSKLKTDSNFITDKIKKDDYLEYINFIEKSQISFNWSHKVLQVDEFIQSKNRIRETEIIDDNTK